MVICRHLICSYFFLTLLLLLLATIAQATTSVDESAPTKKKSLADFDDADLERLYEQWEKNDDGDGKDADEESAFRKSPPPSMNINLNDLKTKGLDEMQRLSKKNKPVMVFVTVSGQPTRRETDELTVLWQNSLFNANYQVTRYVIEDNRAIFMINDGSLAYDIKNFLIKQERCHEVTIDNERYEGVASTQSGSDAKSEKKNAKKSTNNNKTHAKSDL